jgi:Tol biopolymer transport system component
MRTIRTQAKIGAAAVVVGLALLLTLSRAGASFPGANGQIAWSSGGEIWTANPDGSGPVKLTTAGGDHPAWSADGAFITFDRAGEVFTMVANGALQTNVTNNVAADRQPTFSPDGTQIVFASDRNGGLFRIYRMPVAGGVATAVTSTGALPAASDDDAPEWNWANDRIVFQRGVPGEGAGHTAIFSIKADGSDLQRLTTTTSPDGGAYNKLLRPKWSPNGTKVVFEAEAGSCGSRLFIMNANGSSPTAVSKAGACDVADPAWSPDGNLILFQATDVDTLGDGLFAINPSTNAIAELSSDTSATSPDWEPIDGPPPPTTTSTTVAGPTTTSTSTTSTSTTTTTTIKPPTTGGGGARFGVINSCSALYVKEGFLTNSFNQMLNCGDGRAVALGDTRVGVINGCGSFYVRQGALNSPFNQQTGCGDAQAITVSADRVGVINGCGAAYVKQGALNEPFSLQLGCGDARAVAVTDSRLGVINSCGSFYVKEGALANGFDQQTVCGDARAMAVSPNRVAVINSCGALYVKEGALSNPFQLQLNCGDGAAVSLSDNRVGVITGCGAMWVKEGALGNGFTQQTQCGDARAIAVAPNRVAVINSCSAAYVKEGALGGPFSHQLNCGDARAVALNAT